MRITRETEHQIWEAEQRGAGPSSADLRPDDYVWTDLGVDEDDRIYVPDQFDEDGSDKDLPCELCHTDAPRHTTGCPNGEDPNL